MEQNVGKSFMTIKDGIFFHQGEILADLGQEYRVVLFSWLDGSEDSERNLSKDEHFVFFDSDEEMQHYYDTNPQLRQKNLR
jgi:hypothetical protein